MQNSQDNLKDIESLLEFYRGAGVDCFLGDEPVDWVEASARQAAQRHQTPPATAPGNAGAPAQAAMVGETRSPSAPRQLAAAPSRQPAPAQTAVMPDHETIASARDLAASARTLADLKACLETFEGCNLKPTAKTLVFGDGNPGARLMFVGEAPGREEDLQGKPFVGRSGQLLDRMLSAIGLDRKDAYIANVVPWRPPGNRTPTPQETEICKPFIKRQIELVNPDVLVFLGAASAKNLLGVQDGIRKMRGRWMSYALQDREIAAIATYHPAYLLRSPLEKRLSWRDFLSIRARLADH
ncbi:MAG: uracil-DNA glycosylase family protein [Roseibium sp.]|uniref:uracil-DNA glycosylase family protein n=1 Tax=Roseibium sp. TaxID=1936156 RepID=UPI003D9C57CA